MAILDSLKKLGRKMTGSPVQGTDIESAINNIAAGYSGGGGNLIVIKIASGNYEANMSYDELEAMIENGVPVSGLFIDSTLNNDQIIMTKVYLSEGAIVMNIFNNGTLYWQPGSPITDD